MEIQVGYLVLFCLLSLIDSFGWFWVGITHKIIQLMQELLRFHSWSQNFLIYIKGLPDDVFGNITIYADDTTLYSKCYQASDLWQQLDSAP